jgi:hypothetical protein
MSSDYCKRPCQSPVEFKVTCTNPCGIIFTPEQTSDINYIDMIYTSADNDVIPPVDDRIQRNTYTTVVFNNIVDLHGLAISPNLTTGEFTINDTGLYNVSYSAAWNDILYDSDNNSSDSRGLKFVAIAVNSPITNTIQVYAPQSNNSSFNTLGLPSAELLTQNGTASILLFEGDILYMIAYTDGVQIDDDIVMDQTNLISTVTVFSDIIPLATTRIQISKVD